MPRLSEIGDTDAIDDRYAAKTIIYVESDDDEKIFYALSGPGIVEYVEFKPPSALGRGAVTVASEVRARRPANTKIYGLIDGEAAPSAGAVDTLIQCDRLMFTLPGEANDGLIFLGHHEPENILLKHGNLAALIRKDASVAGSAALSDAEIASRIAVAVRHFFQAALLKYASMTLNHAANLTTPKSGCKVIDSGRFLDKRPRREILATIEAGVAAEGVVTWAQLMAEMKRSWQVVRASYKAQPDPDHCARERLRLGDGKSVVTKLARQSGSDPAKWINHLLEDAKATALCDEFRAELFAATKH
ncbi:hypothetical protein [Sphingomonas koreensis]